MSKIKFSCQTYAWIMCGDKYLGKIDHMAKVASNAEFSAIEPMNLQLKSYRDPKRLKAVLEEHNIQMSSMTLVCDWKHPQETEEERLEADQMIELTAQFPGALFMLVQMPGEDRSELETRQKNLIANINEVSRRATDRGLVCTYHPNSPDGSIWRTRADYDKLLPQLDERVLKWTPDVGHIAKGGMDPVALVREYRTLVNHYHFKDMHEDGSWALMGEGTIDFETLIKDMIATDFAGWVIFEDECDRAIDNPDGVMLEDGVYIREKMLPLLNAA